MRRLLASRVMTRTSVDVDVAVLAQLREHRVSARGQ